LKEKKIVEEVQVSLLVDLYFDCYVNNNLKNADHYLLFCNRYIVYRNKMLSSLAILNMNGVEINVDTLLFGNDFLSDETNSHEKCADFFTF
jgi:hypothetical protein